MIKVINPIITLNTQIPQILCRSSLSNATSFLYLNACLTHMSGSGSEEPALNFARASTQARNFSFIRDDMGLPRPGPRVCRKDTSCRTPQLQH
jgi:hypothetical protein